MIYIIIIIISSCLTSISGLLRVHADGDLTTRIQKTLYLPCSGKNPRVISFTLIYPSHALAYAPRACRMCEIYDGTAVRPLTCDPCASHRAKIRLTHLDLSLRPWP